MKKIEILGAEDMERMEDLSGNSIGDITIVGPENMSVSDGYHTMDELYDHRITLFIALARMARTHKVWKSKKHSDGTTWDGWFILGIGVDKGKQITYHLPNSRWDEVSFAQELETAPEFDGHTSGDVLERLKVL